MLLFSFSDELFCDANFLFKSIFNENDLGVFYMFY